MRDEKKEVVHGWRQREPACRAPEEHQTWFRGGILGGVYKVSSVHLFFLFPEPRSNPRLRPLVSRRHWTKCSRPTSELGERFEVI